MSARFSDAQVREMVTSGDLPEQESNDLEEEVSEEEDGEEYNPEHDASSSDEEEIPQGERETLLSKNSKIA